MLARLLALLAVLIVAAAEVCVCTNTCTHARDGTCNDGGPGSADGTCRLGTDCEDCGPSERGAARERGALCPAQLRDLERKEDGAWRRPAAKGGGWEAGCAEGRGRAREGAPCAPCAPGRAASEAQPRCVRCARGRYSDAPGAAACAPCPAGRWQAWSRAIRDAGSCQPCAIGRVVEAAAQVSDTCVRCPLGKYSGPRGDECVGSCPPGSRLAANIWGQKTGCAECPAGRFQAEGGDARCAPCPLGSYAFAGSQGCTSCAARCDAEAYPQDCGAGGMAGSCVSCEQGRRAEWAAHPRCHHCPRGRVQDPHQYHLCNARPTPVPTPAPAAPPTEGDGGTWLTTRHGKAKAKHALHRGAGDASPSAWFAAFHRVKQAGGTAGRTKAAERKKKQKRKAVKKFDSYEDMVKALAQRIRAPGKKGHRQKKA